MLLKRLPINLGCIAGTPNEPEVNWVFTQKRKKQDF